MQDRHADETGDMQGCLSLSGVLVAVCRLLYPKPPCACIVRLCVCLVVVSVLYMCIYIYVNLVVPVCVYMCIYLCIHTLFVFIHVDLLIYGLGFKGRCTQIV